MDEFQAFTPVTESGDRAGYEFLLFLLALVGKINELESRIEALEAFHP